MSGRTPTATPLAELRDAVASQRPVSVEILNYKRDGTPFWNAVFVGPVFDTSGELLYFFASQFDVSRRREAGDGHRQAQKMEAVGQLTAGLAHDFKNLIQIVAGNHELLLAEVEAPGCDASSRTPRRPPSAQRGSRASFSPLRARRGLILARST